MGPRAGLDGCGKSCRYQDWSPRTSNLQQVAVLTALSQLTREIVEYSNYRQLLDPVRQILNILLLNA